MYSFVEIRKNRFGRRWGIKKDGKIIQQGYNFIIGKRIFQDEYEKIKTLTTNTRRDGE